MKILSRLTVTLLVCLFWFAVPSAVDAYIEKSGDVSSEIWTPGTYVVTGDVTIQNNTTLTVQAGAVVKFESGKKLISYGTLDVNGVSDNPVIFTSLKDDSYGGDTNGDEDYSLPAPGDWNGIYLNGQGDNQGIGEFDWCVVRYGDDTNSSATPRSNIRFHESDSGHFINSVCEYSGYYGIWIENCSPTISNSSFADSKKHGVYINGGSPAITDNTFTDNENYGVYLSSVREFTSYTGNTFSGNGVNGFGITGSVVKDNTISGTSTFVLDSTLTVNEGVILTVESGIVIKGSANKGMLLVSGTLDVNGVSDNPVVFTSLKDDSYGGDTNGDEDYSSPAPGDWNGIHLNGQGDNQGIGEFDWCIIRYGGKQRPGYGSDPQINIQFYESDSGHFINSVCEYSSKYGIWVENCSPKFRRSYIENNARYGIYIPSGLPDLGSNDIEDQGWNIFRNNDNGNYHVYSATQDDINAHYNYWEYTTAQEIDVHIYDDDENSNSGQVLFSLWLEPTSRDLVLDKKVDKVSADMGSELIYTLSYMNQGAVDHTDIVIEDILPDELEMQEESVSDSGIYDQVNRKIIWSIPRLQAQLGIQTVNFKANLRAGTPIGTSVVNTAAIRSAENPSPIIATAAMVTTETLVLSLNLETAIREALNKPTEPITVAELEELIQLDASGRGISDLTGIENCTNLTSLDLGNNQISDIALLVENMGTENSEMHL